MSNQFRHAAEGHNTGTSHEFTATAMPKAQIEFRIDIASPKAHSNALFRLPRFRVRALHHMLGEWLEATKGQDD